MSDIWFATILFATSLRSFHSLTIILKLFHCTNLHFPNWFWGLIECTTKEMQTNWVGASIFVDIDLIFGKELHLSFKTPPLKYFTIKCTWGKGFVLLVYTGVTIFSFNAYVLHYKAVLNGGHFKPSLKWRC